MKVVSATNLRGERPLAEGKTKLMIGRVQFTEAIRPGVVGFALGYGQATGSSDVVMDGEVIKGDPRRPVRRRRDVD